MMDLPNWTVHVLTFLAGVATWLPFTLWEGNRVTHPPGEPMTEPTELDGDGTPQEWRRLAHIEERLDAVETVHEAPARRRLRLGVITLVASALIIGFGVQQGIYQHQQTEQHKTDRAQARCIASYNADVETVRNDRLVANDNLADAQTAKDNAGDNVLLVTLDLIQSNGRDPKAVKTLTRALIRFARKKARLATVQQTTDTTLEHNPYPTLDC